MEHVFTMELRNQPPDCDPIGDLQRAHRQTLGERLGVGDHLGDQIATIKKTVTHHPRTDRRRHRQAERMQVDEQQELAYRPGRALSPEEIAIGGQACHEAAAPIVPQRISPAAGLEKERRAAAMCRTADRATRRPPCRLEPEGAQIVGAQGVV